MISMGTSNGRPPTITRLLSQRPETEVAIPITARMIKDIMMREEKIEG